MRIAVGQLWQETNTFNRNPTVLAGFEQWGVAVGAAVVAEYGATGELGGFVHAVKQWARDIELVGLARYACWPWGAVSGETWRPIQQTFREQLEQASPVDAVFLALHGAMAAANEPDVTGALLQWTREIVGPSVPVIGSLDLHANITGRMIAAADVLVGYHACPHIDTFQTGERAADALRVLLETRRHPTTLVSKLPMITPAENHNTFTGPPAPLYERLKEWESDGDVLSAGLYMAMPWCDVPELGWTVTLTTVGNSARWERRVRELSDDCWKLRRAMCDVDRLSPAEIVDRFVSSNAFPVVVGDGADATNSGSPGDSTALLSELLSRESLPHGALTFVVDPDAVAVAAKLGTGQTFDGFVGGNFAPEYNTPVQLRGTVERIVKLEFTLDGHIGKNLPIRMGTGVVIRSGDVTVLLCEKSGPGSTPLLYESAGLEPREFGLVVAKSPSGFRADYESFAAEILLLDSPGCASPHLSRLNFYEANRPLWPLDRVDSPEIAGWC